MLSPFVLPSHSSQSVSDPEILQVDITQAQTSITTSTNSGSQKRALGDFASLDVPMSPAKTDVISRRIALNFQNVPFRSLADNLFSNFLTETTNGESVTLGLTGFANSQSLSSRSHFVADPFSQLLRRLLSETSTWRTFNSRSILRSSVFKVSTLDPLPSVISTWLVDSQITFRSMVRLVQLNSKSRC